MENVVQTLHSSQKNLIKALKELELATNEYNRLVNKQVPYSEQELEKIEILRKKKGYICDMDGTLWVAKVTTKGQSNRAIPGAATFIKWALDEGKQVLCLTNGSSSTPEHLRAKLKKLLGIDLPTNCFVNSTHSTASFIAQQQPGASCFMIGSKALKKSLLEYGLKIVKEDPDYVVMGESREYRYEDITNAINFVNKGARFIATNDDVVDIDEVGHFQPSTGSFAKIVEAATGVKAYYLGKPNSLMIRHAMDRMHCNSDDCAIIGDRMDTDILAGTEARITPVLVLTGVTKREQVKRYPYQPYVVLNSIVDIVPQKDNK